MLRMLNRMMLGGLDAVIFLTRGAAVTLSSNLWQEVGLCNGATVVVEDLLFRPDRPLPCLPIAALVHFIPYTGPAFLPTNPKTVPIPTHLFIIYFIILPHRINYN